MVLTFVKHQDHTHDNHRYPENEQAKCLGQSMRNFSHVFTLRCSIHVFESKSGHYHHERENATREKRQAAYR